MPSTPWTPEQRRGIETVGRSLLVSAAAGSGKTAMLAERCAHLVCDADEPCDVDALLVVTFTEAAAAEMKSRIHNALRARAEASGSARIHHQLALIDHASVSTLHAFCARLLREHFQAVGLDPAFSVLDGEEAGLLRREIVRRVFDDRYELDHDGAFHRFVDDYGEGDDSTLAQQVVSAFEMLQSLVDPAGWIARSREQISEAAGGDFDTSELGRQLHRLVSEWLKGLRASCDQTIKKLAGFPKYAPAAAECAQNVRYWMQQLEEEGLDTVAEHIRTWEKPRLPPVKGDVEGKEQAKAAIDAIRDEIAGSIVAKLLRFSVPEMQVGLKAIQPHVETFLSLVEQFGQAYRQAKDSSRVVDFSDLERFALQALRDPTSKTVCASEIARGYHARFAHVLVDEYQDINEIQDAILTLLSRECVAEQERVDANLFCVGDVKQSIYRFRLAETGRFLGREQRFRQLDSAFGSVIDLQKNFRSRGPLLAAINGIFELLMSAKAVDIEYDDSHQLHPGLNYPTGADDTFAGAPLELHILPAKPRAEGEDAPDEADDVDRTELEALLAARRIRQIVGADGSPPMRITESKKDGRFESRPATYKDIVVLLRAMRHKSTQFADVFRRAGIPVHAQSSSGYFESMEVRDMLALLNILENQRQDIPLAAVLRSPLANLPEAEDCLARIRIKYPVDRENPLPFHDAVVRYAAEQTDELAAALGDFFDRLSRWRFDAYSRPLSEVVHAIYQETGYRAFCFGLADGEQRVANLDELLRRSAQFGSFRRQGLSRFLRLLHSLSEEEDIGQPSTATEADNVVRVLSIHRSKGLEFPVVIIPDLGKRMNLRDSAGSIVFDRQAGLGMEVVDSEKMIRYPSLASSLVKQRLQQQAKAEELRVLYVALTRAREHLILIGTAPEKNPDTWRRNWTNFSDQFPADMVLHAQTSLDWIGPAAVALGEGVISTTVHLVEEVREWQMAHAQRSELTEVQQRLARLEPLSEAPARSESAERIIQRLKSPYAFAALTKAPAAEAVTRLAHAAKPGRSSAKSDALSTGSLSMPRFMGEQTASAADIGEATHRVLLHLNFSARCDRASIEQQIQQMVDRRLITPAQAAMVERSWIEWFVQTDLGGTLRKRASALRREMPIYFASPIPETKSTDPMDQTMVRGRIDLLVETNEGLILIDYKTDKILAEAARRRANSYAGQMNFYREALVRMTGKPVAQAHIVFLSPGVIQTF